jgi:hypothetical protein
VTNAENCAKIESRLLKTSSGIIVNGTAQVGLRTVTVQKEYWKNILKIFTASMAKRNALIW